MKILYRINIENCHKEYKYIYWFSYKGIPLINSYFLDENNVNIKGDKISIMSNEADLPVVKKIVNDIIKKVINIKEELKTTTESQGHGKPFEIEVLCVIGFCKEKILSYPHGSRYDGKKVDSLDKRNKSVKTTGKNAPDCGDIKNFLTSEEMDIIIICYKQEGNYKIVKKTYVINFDSIKKVIKDDLADKYVDIPDGDLRYEKWIKEIKKYVKIVIKAPKKTKISELNKIYNKKKLELPYFGIRPKTDQNRVQCELKLIGENGILKKIEKGIDYFEEEGANIEGKTFISKIFAERRSRDGVTIKSLINYCEKNGKYNYPKKKKAEIIEFVLEEFNIENYELLREALIKHKNT